MEKDTELLSDENLKSGMEANKIADTKASPTEAQRARAERNRQIAREKREARLLKRPNAAALDTGGGFLLQEEEPAPSARAAPGPVVLREEQPRCLLCHARFPQSFLFDNFDYSVCDSCRDDEDAHRLMTRTEAKAEFLLQDCDLDLRPPALRCVRRRNPHRARAADMRLYVRAQLQERARLVWGAPEALLAERERRAARRQRAADSAARRRLRALRMDVRSSLYDARRGAHEHRFGPERHDAADVYSRACDCGHVETYEKM